MDRKVTGIVAYLTWVGWLIAFFAGDKEGAKFHLNQSLVLMLAGLILGIVIGIIAFIPFIGWIISGILGIGSLVIFVFWVMGLVFAIQGQDKAVPLFGSIRILK